jgi:hypothetical protein
VADGSRRVSFEALDTDADEPTGKPVAMATRYSYAGDDDERWTVPFTRDRDLAKSRMHGPKRVLAQLARFDGAYRRFAGRELARRVAAVAEIA